MLTLKLEIGAEVNRHDFSKLSEIEQLEGAKTPHSLARARELNEQRAQIFLVRLSGQLQAVA